MREWQTVSPEAELSTIMKDKQIKDLTDEKEKIVKELTDDKDQKIKDLIDAYEM